MALRHAAHAIDSTLARPRETARLTLAAAERVVSTSMGAGRPIAGHARPRTSKVSNRLAASRIRQRGVEIA